MNATGPGARGAPPPAPRPTQNRRKVRERRYEYAPAPALEHEADRVAALVVSGDRPLFGPSKPLAPRSPLPEAAAVQGVLREPGRPLDPAFQARMESRLGYDLSLIRVHTGDEAAHAAASFDALAFAAGRHIVFDAEQYCPDSFEGRMLLAHELAHVIQQANTSAPPLLTKKKKLEKPVKFYQAVIEEVAEQRDKIRKDGPFFTPHTFKNNVALLDLCEAVDQGKTGDIPKLLKTLLDTGLVVPLSALSEDLVIELVARLYQLGLGEEAQKLRDAYHEGVKSYQLSSWDLGLSRRNIDIFSRQIDLAAGAVDLSSGETVRNSLTQMVRALEPLRDAFLDIDLDALQREQQDLRYNPFLQPLRPGMLHYEYYEALMALIQRLMSTMESLLQTVVEMARTELENGTSSGADKLNLLYGWLEMELKPALAKVRNGKDITNVQIKIIHVDFKGKGKGSISDAFPPPKGTRKAAVDITTYDPEQDFVPDQTASIAHLYRIRLNQIAVLARLYGAPDLVRKTSANQAEAIETAEDMESNQRAIGTMAKGKLKLDSDDDWRKFVMAKYEDLTNPSPGQARLKKQPADALHAVVDILFAYLKAFTVHVHAVNIYDIGPSYINLKFPRALSGQLVHDCGVYAVRVAYILSLVRDKLKLKFHFVLLPAHIALVMEKSGLPTYIFENDNYDEISPQRAEELQDNFDAFIEDASTLGDKVDPVARLRSYRKDTKQLVGEMAAVDYIDAPADMPFRVVDIDLRPGASIGETQRKLWQTYEDTVQDKSKDIFGPSTKDKKDPSFLFHKRYLDLTQKMREAHNETLLPLWNVKGPAAWDKFVAAATNAGPKLKASELAGLLQAYADDFAKAAKPYEDSSREIDIQSQAISDAIRSDPKILGKNAGPTYGRRAFEMINKPVREYTAEIKRVLTLVSAMPPAETVNVGEVTDLQQASSKINLFPPFMPRDTARLQPVE